MQKELEESIYISGKFCPPYGGYPRISLQGGLKKHGNRQNNLRSLGDTLLIHMPKELDLHNCRDLKRDTDLMLDENYINRIIFDFWKNGIYGFFRDRSLIKSL